MYSGSDSNESQKYANWPLNPASFQSVPGEQVDWAALAQQWIIMKEAGPPPIPGEQNILINKKKSTQEGGEADMDVEKEKEAPPPPSWGTNEPPPPPGSEAWNWSTQISQHNHNWNNWNNSWAPPSAVPPPAPNISTIKPPLLPTPPNNSYNEPPESSSDNAVPFGSYNSNLKNEYHTTSPPYWNNSSVPPKHIKPHNKRYSKVNVPIRTSAPLPPMALPVETIATPAPPPALDNAKRKQLPAWIREGLEKMEKEKLKQMEKEKEKEERDTYNEQNKQPIQDTMEILKSAMKERQKSRFESDEDNSNEDNKKQKKHASDNAVPLTQEELMLKVRRTMTEILLNVTNRQIEAICKEELQRYTKNRKDAASAPSGANIRGRLGLGIYGDDSGSSSDEERDEEYQHVSRDSDDELKDTIKKKMAEFQKTEREIEDKLEEAERRKGGSVSRSSSPASIDNDSQVDARTQGRKYFQHDTRQSTPPKSAPEPKLKQRSPSSSSQESDYSNNRSKASRRSSSGDSKDSYKKSSKRRSITPEKRYRSTSSRWSKSPTRRKDSNGSKRDSGSSRKKSTSSRRSRSSSYSRSRRSRSSSYRKSRRSRSRERSKRSRSSSRSRSRYSSRRSPSSSRSDRKRRRRSRSDSSGRGKRSHRH